MQYSMYCTSVLKAIHLGNILTYSYIHARNIKYMLKGCARHVHIGNFLVYSKDGARE